MTPLETARQMVLDYRGTFASDQGQRVLENLSCGSYEKISTFVRNDPTGSAFNEGRRMMILHIRRMLEADPNSPTLLKDLENGR